MTKHVKRPDYSEWQRREVRIADLYLDPQNIRIQVDVSLSQAALINDLFYNENAMQVLRSIADNGFFPDELPVVTKEGKKFTVIEGNRRVAALKLLSRPEILPNKEAIVKEIRKTAARIPRELSVVEAPSRDAVRHFLASKHTQNTRRPWRPLRQAHFYEAEMMRGKTIKDLKNEYPGVDIERFLRLINMYKIAKSIDYDSPSVAKKIHNQRTFPASTLERLYDDKNVRDFLGISFKNAGEVKIEIAKKEFIMGYRQIIRDIVDKIIDSRNLNTGIKRQEYLDNFPQKSIPKKSKQKKPITSKDFTEKPPPKTAKSRKLAPNDIAFKISAPGVKRMLHELQKINHRKFPNASHDLLRSFLECTLKVYFLRSGDDIKAKRGKFVQLKDVLQRFKIKMDKISNRRLSQVAKRILSSDNMISYSAEFLNATNHNPEIFVEHKDVEVAWDTMECIFRYILDPPSE